ncbi:MAG: Ferripyoverdine receptor [Variovorax sp.]|nr:MAG: Ferripyoverdine receptor [Variovorax sp.]
MAPALASTTADPVAAAVPAPVQPQPLAFDIPAQPLASALERYAVIADQTVLFSDALVAGRVSAPVQGLHLPRVALAALLEGTGLTAENPGGKLRDAFVLRPVPVEIGAVPAIVPGLDRRYDGLVQTRVWEALCADARTAPGNYRASLRLNVDAEGRLEAPRLIGATGNAARDRAIVAALSGLRMDHPPPPELRQPLLLVILPRERVAVRACEAGAAS